MLETLLESHAKRGRSAGGAIASISAHTLLIGAALYATTQATVQPTGSPAMVRPVYFPPARHPVSESRATTPQKRIHSRRLIFVEPNLDIHIAPVDIAGVVSTDVLSKPGDFGPSPLTPTGSNPGGERVPSAGDTPFRADQVEKQVSVVAGSPPPRYPEILRSSGVEGQVTAVFVVDEKGRADDSSIQFVRSDNQLFEDAVRVALRHMRFIPAEVGGIKVKQLVQMPFVFTLAR
jgi:protein TonB